MLRQARLDTPGALHRVIERNIERTRIFCINADREDFLDRLGDLCMEVNLIVYAWCLMPNHFQSFSRLRTNLRLKKYLKVF